MIYNINDYLKAPIYSSKIEEEKAKPNTYKCFMGAWYYKILSAKDKWLGIEAEVTLPEFNPDLERFDILKDQFCKEIKRYKDTPSIYVGGCSDFENDVGLGWFRGKINNKVTGDKITYRPFYRYIYQENNEIKNIYAGPNIDLDEYYYFPGDRIKINVFCTRENHLQFRIELIKETNILKYKNIRELLKKPKVFLSEEFVSPGSGIRDSEYKRVNAIDQYGNESKPTQNTNAKVNKCIWHNTYLFRKYQGQLIKVEFDISRHIKMLCPTSDAFKIYLNENNEEEVLIMPEVVAK